MAYSLTWLSNVLVNAGLKVAETDGWQTRGHDDMDTVLGVICHHTATVGTQGNMPTLDTLINGRPDLSGPLCQLGLGRDGTYYIVAAGKGYHAGAGSWQGIVTGNSNFIGIEAENTGGDDDPWPFVQMDAYHRGVAAILQYVGKGAEFCAGHKEYALPAGRKTDPDFDMVAFRAEVSAVLQGTAPPPNLIPANEPATPGRSTGRPTLRRGIYNDPALVSIVQTAIGVTADGIFGPDTEAAVRAFQSANNAVPDGIVGPLTWALIDKTDD
jgi:peptidoglycan hydrolase-like protein with peptidoglycan-binding domain